MRLLLCVATPSEIPNVSALIGNPDPEIHTLYSGSLHGFSTDVLISGIGMVNTAYELGRYFALHKPDFAFNLGIAGSFQAEMELGSVVEVREDCFAELGAEDGHQFLNLEEMGFEAGKIGGKAFYHRFSNPRSGLPDYPGVSGITVNKVHGEENSILRIKQRLEPEVETMEGAAFFQACLMNKVPFHALRGISNRVERRNRANWKIGPAIRNVENAVLNLIKNGNFRHE